MAAAPLILANKDPEFIGGSNDPKLGINAVKLKCWAPDLVSALGGAAPVVQGLEMLREWQPRTFSVDPSGTQGGYHVNVTLEGHVDPDNADDEYFEIEGSTTDDPIESHWNFDVLLSVYGGGRTPDSSTGKMIWPRKITSSDNGQQVRNKMFGIDSWAAPGLIWNHNYVRGSLPESLIDTLGVLVTPPGNPPKLTGNRDWLCIRIRGRQRGNIWQLCQSYQISGPGGSIPEMYRVASR